MESAGGLPGVSVTAEEHIILHVDNDCFYAACERIRDPSLESEPVIVGMGFEPGESGGVVATASYEAREYGIESAQPISEAMEKLPPRGQSDAVETGIYRPVDMSFYQTTANQVKEILHAHADIVREVSIDEAYLDCTEQTSWNDVYSFARQLKATIEDQLGLPVSIGVGPSMSVAKIASDIDKPDGLRVVHPGEVTEFLEPLPVKDLHGVGPKTASALHADGIESIGDFAAQPTDKIRDHLGDRGVELHQRARGIDRRTVSPRGDPKSLSRESAFSEPTTDVEEIRERLKALAAAVASRAQEKGALYQTIGIKVVTPPFEIATRERSLPGPIDDSDIVTSVACELLKEFEGESIRKIGVRVANLSFSGGDQARLGTWESAQHVSTGESIQRENNYHRDGQTSLSDYSSDE